MKRKMSENFTSLFFVWNFEPKSSFFLLFFQTESHGILTILQAGRVEVDVHKRRRAGGHPELRVEPADALRPPAVDGLLL